MKKNNSGILSIIIFGMVLISIAGFLCVSFILPKIIISNIEKSISKSLEYKSAYFGGLSEFVFDELKIKDKSNVAFYAEKAKIKLDLKNIFQSKAVFIMHFDHAGFFKEKMIESIFKMLSLNPEDGSDFKTIDFILIKRQRDIAIKDLVAINKFLTIKASGTRKTSGELNFNLSIIFSKDFFNSLEESLRDSFWNKATGGSGEINFKIEGSLESPSILIQANLFNEDQIKLEVHPISKNE